MGHIRNCSGPASKRLHDDGIDKCSVGKVVLVGARDITVVKATAGDTHLDVDNFDDRVSDFCMQDLKGKNCVMDLGGNSHSLSRLRTQRMRAKRTLLSSTQATIDIESVMDG